MPVSTILVIQHTAICPPAHVGQWLAEAGCTLDVRHPYRGDELPSSLADHDGFVVLGGQMGAQDDAAFGWLTRTKDLLREAVRDEVPTWGICLGHQLLAVALGGQISRSPVAPFAGVQPVELTAAALTDPLLGALGADAVAVHWNNDVVTEVPDGAVVLSQTGSDVQSLRIGAVAWGVQFHPEVDEIILAPWAAADVTDGLLPADDAQGRLREVAARRPALASIWQAASHRFAAIVSASAENCGATTALSRSALS